MEIQEIQKAELHRHLELCLRPSTIKELAPSFGIELPNEKAFEDRFLIMEPMKDLGSVLNKFLDTQKLLATPEILERIAFEACEDAYKKDNIRILELRYAPTFVAENHPDLDFDLIHESFLRGIQTAEVNYPIAVGLTCIIQRIHSVDIAKNVVDFAINNSETFDALDLADNEVGFDSKPFAPHFERARAAGLHITVHSGEANVEKAPRYVRDAIDYLGAERIGHGLQIHRDPEMIEYVKSKNVVLELCPTSNWLTQAIESLSDHPFRKLEQAGVKVTINSDDPGIFNIDLNNEYRILKEQLGFSIEELETLAHRAAQESFIPIEKRQKVWSQPLSDV